VDVPVILIGTIGGEGETLALCVKNGKMLGSDGTGGRGDDSITGNTDEGSKQASGSG